MFKLGIIGTGQISHEFIQAAKLSGSYQLQAVYSRSMVSAQTFAKPYQDVKLYTDLAAFLERPLDIVYIASPNSLHFQHAKQAILAGKNAIIEKPAVSRPEQWQELMDLSIKHKVFIFEAARNYHEVAFNSIRQFLADKTIWGAHFTFAKYSSKMKFAEVVPVSALKGTNTDKLLEVIFKYLAEGPMYYDEDTVTDQPIKQIAAELIREKALRFLQEEIPHGIAVEIDTFSYRDSGDMVDIEAAIVCEKDSHKGIIIGKAGSMLKRIGTAARKDIEGLLEARVNLKLWVKVRPKWRDSDVQMKNFGYNPKDL